MAETTITEHAPFVTLINVFTVEPERQRELLSVLTTASDEVMHRLPGFISANFDAGTAGTKAVNYVQWETGETLRRLGRILLRASIWTVLAVLSRRAGRAMDLAVHVEPHIYTVEAVHHR